MKSSRSSAGGKRSARCLIHMTSLSYRDLLDDGFVQFATFNEERSSAGHNKGWLGRYVACHEVACDTRRTLCEVIMIDALGKTRDGRKCAIDGVDQLRCLRQTRFTRRLVASIDGGRKEDSRFCEKNLL